MAQKTFTQTPAGLLDWKAGARGTRTIVIALSWHQGLYNKTFFVITDGHGK